MGKISAEFVQNHGTGLWSSLVFTHCLFNNYSFRLYSTNKSAVNPSLLHSFNFYFFILKAAFYPHNPQTQLSSLIYISINEGVV